MPASRLFVVVSIFMLCVSCAARKHMFRNPLLSSGADPWSIHHNGFYYYTHTMGDSIVVWKTTHLTRLKNAERKTIYIPPRGTNYSRELWAPEIHYLDSAWYVYFAADDGNNNNHRLYVIENKSSDPFNGPWQFKGKVADGSDKWAIDGSVFVHNKQLYMTWSGWEGDTNRQQDIYISRMTNPWTLSGQRVRISSPVYEWERHGDLHDANNPPHVAVNEGPQFLRNNDKLFIIYSASGCWTDQYGLGMLMTRDTSNLLDSASWYKHPQRIFSSHPGNSVYAPGHNSFFISPDGSEHWILYHANGRPSQGCGRNRSPRAQKFTWNSDGTPKFDEPVRTGKWIKAPSADKKQQHE